MKIESIAKELKYKFMFAIVKSHKENLCFLRIEKK